MGNTGSDSSSDNESIDELENENVYELENEKYHKNSNDEVLSENMIEHQSLKGIINIEWKQDTLDFKNVELKTSHTLETLLHNYFLMCDKNKIININIKKYSTQEKTKYCKLLLKIHKSIKENEEMIEDVLENFPFEYKSIDISDEIINEITDETDNINVSVIDNLLRIFEFYTQSKYSKIYCLYNLFLENENKDTLSIKQGLDSINKNGICLYDDCTTEFEEPSTNAYRKAHFRNQLKCFRIKQNINDLKHCLSEKKPVIFGISTYESFYKYEHIELPKKNEKKICDTCMILVGYNDEEKEWIIKNDKLYKVSFNYLLNKNLCKDFWIFET